MADLLKSITGVLELTGLKSSLATVRKQYSAAQCSLDTLKREREEIAAAHLSKVDLMAAASRWTDAQLEVYRARLAETLLTVASNPRHLTDADLALTNHDGHWWSYRLFGLDGGPHQKDQEHGVTPEALVLLLGPDAIKAALRREIESLQIPTEGLPMIERRARLAHLDQQIGKADSALSELRRDAAEAGITFDATVAGA